MSENQKKYLKYKSKYLNLKMQKGGGKIIMGLVNGEDSEILGELGDEPGVETEFFFKLKQGNTLIKLEKDDYGKTWRFFDDNVSPIGSSDKIFNIFIKNRLTGRSERITVRSSTTIGEIKRKFFEKCIESPDPIFSKEAADKVHLVLTSGSLDRLKNSKTCLELGLNEGSILYGLANLSMRSILAPDIRVRISNRPYKQYRKPVQELSISPNTTIEQLKEIYREIPDPYRRRLFPKQGRYGTIYQVPDRLRVNHLNYKGAELRNNMTLEEINNGYNISLNLKADGYDSDGPERQNNYIARRRGRNHQRYDIPPDFFHNQEDPPDQVAENSNFEEQEEGAP